MVDGEVRVLAAILPNKLPVAFLDDGMLVGGLRIWSMRREIWLDQRTEPSEVQGRVREALKTLDFEVLRTDNSD
jgi:hypothetical protein